LRIRNYTLFLVISVALFFFRDQISCSPNEKIELGKKWKFIITGDCRGEEYGSGVNDRILTKIAKAIIDESAEFVLFVGDLIYGHADRKGLGDEKALQRIEFEFLNYRCVMQPVYDCGITVYNVRGNHCASQRLPNHEGHPDHRPIWPATKTVWDKVFSGKYAMPDNGPEGEKNVTFSDVRNNAFIVGLDVYSTPVLGAPLNMDGSINFGYFHQVQQTWLDEQLAANRQPHVFVFCHEPAFKVDHTDCLHGDNAFGVDYSKERDIFWNSLQDAGARVYFCGHDHGYAHARIDDGDGYSNNDLHQFVVGTAGAGTNINPNYDGYNGSFQPIPLVQDNSFGYLLAEIDGLNVTLTYKRLADEINGVFEAADVFRYTMDNTSNFKKDQIK